MDDAPIQDNLSSARYGAFVLVTHLMHRIIDNIIISLQQHDMSALAVFAKLADDMIAVVEHLESTPEAADAQRQLVALLRQHRSFIVSPAPFTDNPVRNAALAEIQEMDSISVAALDRLGRRLGLFQE